MWSKGLANARPEEMQVLYDALFFGGELTELLRGERVAVEYGE